MNKLLSTGSLVALILFFIFILGTQLNVFAQETSSDAASATEAAQIVNADENIQAEALGVSEPTLLPTNPFYFLKNWGRGIRSVFTFDAVKKAELRMRFANEKIIEAKKVVELTNNAEAVKEALGNYQEEVKQVQNRVEAIKAQAVGQAKVDAILNKLTDTQFKHQKLLDRIEKNLPVENLAEIKLVKEGTAQKLSEAALKIESPEKFKERIIKITESQSGSQFKNFKNLEVLKILEEKVPEQAREAIKQAAENSLNRLQGDLEKMSAEDRTKFKDYLGAISGNEIRHIEIIDELQAREIPQAVRNAIENSKEATTKRIDEKLEAITTSQVKEAFLGHLREGGLEKIRVIKELENNLAPEAVSKMIDVKNAAIDNFKGKMIQPQQRETILEKIEKFRDIRTFGALEEIDKVISPEQKTIITQLKEKAVGGIVKDLKQVKTEKAREMLFEKMMTDNPEEIRIFKEMEKFAPPELKAEAIKIKERQLEKIETRLKDIDDPRKLELLKERINIMPDVRSEIQILRPQIIEQFTERKEVIIEKTKKLFGEVEIIIKKFESLLIDWNNKEGIKPAIKLDALLQDAKERFERAKIALNEGNYGEAHGQLTSAMNLARKGIGIITGEGPVIIPVGQCPQYAPPSPDYIKKCKDQGGRLESSKNDKGCYGPLRCVIKLSDGTDKEYISRNPQECAVIKYFCDTKAGYGYFSDESGCGCQRLKPSIVCTEQYDPVCGADGKTYSNKCYAVRAGTTASYKGECGNIKPLPEIKPLPMPDANEIKPVPMQPGINPETPVDKILDTIKPLLQR